MTLMHGPSPCAQLPGLKAISISSKSYFNLISANKTVTIWSCFVVCSEETITRNFRKLPFILYCFSALMYLFHQPLEHCLPSHLLLLPHSSFNGLLCSQKLYPASWCLYERQIIPDGNIQKGIAWPCLQKCTFLGNLHNYDLRMQVQFWVLHATRQAILS